VGKFPEDFLEALQKDVGAAWGEMSGIEKRKSRYKNIPIHDVLLL